MPTVLNVKPEDFDSNEKRSKYTVSVVGCGPKGIFYANAFADQGFKVVCTDADASLVKKVAKGRTVFSQPEVETKLKSHTTAGHITTVTELKKAVSQSDITIITLAVKIDEQKKIDCSEIVNTCKQIGASLRQGSLVIYCGIAGFGFVEGTLRETLENNSGFKAGLGFGLAYNPFESVDELKVAGIGKISQESAENILRTIGKKITGINDIKTAEIAALFTIAKRDANMALANELAVFCENTSVDYFEVFKLLNSNAQYLLPKVLEENNDKDVYLLLDSAETLNAKLKLPALARQINEDMVKHAVGLTQDALRSCGKTLRRARVAVIGALDPAATGIFVQLIEQKGAKATLYDPTIKKDQLDSRIIKSSLNEALEGADCMVILAQNHLNLKKIKPIMKAPAIIIDLTGGLKPQEVKAEGFIYCGLGRGIV